MADATVIHFNSLLAKGLNEKLYKTILRSKATGKPVVLHIQFPTRPECLRRGIDSKILHKLIEDVEQAWDGPIGQQSRNVVKDPDMISSLITFNVDTCEFSLIPPVLTKETQ